MYHWETVGSILDFSLAPSGEGKTYVSYRDNGNSSKATVKKYNDSASETVGNAGFSTNSASAWETVGNAGFSVGKIGHALCGLS
jgi:hypothetical protein